MNSNHHAMAGLLRLPAVLALIPISRSGLYQRIQDGKFPPPIKVGRSSLWRVRDILALVERGGV